MNILLVEDNLDHFEIIESAIVGFDHGDAKVTHATSLEQAKKEMSQATFDVFLFDLSLPDSNIEQTVDYLTHLNIDTPIVVLSSLDDLGLAKRLLRHHIQDYIPKDEITPSFLNRVCSYAIERKIQQNKLEKRNTDMQAFCSMLSHDFKGTIRRIGHVATFLQEDLSERLELTEKENKFFLSIQRNTLNIQSMVDSLHEYLTVSYTSVSFELIDSKELLDSLELELSESRDKAFTLIKEAQQDSIYGHKSLISHMLLNIISNAIKYNENQPHVTVTISNVPDKKTKIVVEDNGIGIEKKFHSDIFKPFKRLFSESVYSGTGLGLSIVARVVELHNGEITLESEQGKGSRFTILLPHI